ncbi:hypothetical protein H5410_062200 [Solanum commersonii]|uniref:Uncharacterized protein n=1 Tax=Solanum commersonii TaxID=4109 RepID=A0A9J5WA74_SOLCO|nr:hypothetical protein H5410_062200 [Solanum commersonii]
MAGDVAQGITKENSTNVWYITRTKGAFRFLKQCKYNTGASDHMIHNHAYLYHKHIIESKGIVQLPTGDLATISHIGSLKLNETEMINDVLYPAHVNTITVSQEQAPSTPSHYVLPRNRVAGQCLYPIADVVDYCSITPSYRSFVTKFSQEREPTSYHEAVHDRRWIEVMKHEIQALEDNHT